MEKLSFLKLLLFLVDFSFLFIPISSHGHFSESKNHVALFIFGDSMFDAGNNNYINTSTPFQANFWPYGETFFKYPTGRFSDGRLIPDFIAEYAKLPLLPPYKQPGNHEIINGVNFASSGAGALVETYQGYMVIDLNTQLVNFNKVKKLLEQQVGDKEANKILSRAVYLFSIGNNDYLSPFFINSTIFQSHSREEYVEMVIGNLTNVIKEIYVSGGRNFGFPNLGPLGCAPSLKALYSPKTGHCIDKVTALCKLHNIALSKALKKLERQLQGFKYSYFNFYASFMDRIKNPLKYGFKDGKSACCGSGPYRGLTSCGGKRGIKEYQLCSNASEYIFFDFVHPTERAYQQLAKLMWSGTPKNVGPYNLKALFEQRQM